MFPVADRYEVSYSADMVKTFPKHPDLAQEVSAYLTAHGVKATTFGKQALGDPSLIATLESGRELRSDTIRRIRHFMLTGRSKQTAGAA